MRKQLFILLTLISFGIQAQTYEGRVYNAKNGLCDNDIWDFFQDKKGFFWIITGKGVNVYDGKSFKKFPDKLTEISEGPDGIIYGLAYNQIFKYSPLKKIETIGTKFISDKIYVPDKEAYAKVSKYMDAEGFIYYYFTQGGLKEKKDTIIIYKNGIVKKISISDKISKGYKADFFLDNQKKIWVFFINHKTGEKELSCFENGNLKDIKANLAIKENPSDIFQCKNKDLLIFSNTEVYKLTGTSLSQLSIPERNIFSFMNYRLNKAEDSKGNVWATYEHGLIKISGNTIELVHDFKPRAIKCDSMIETSYDNNGKETHTSTWMCDGSTFAGGIAIDSKDRIYSGNKVYHNGKFTEVFPVKEIVIYKIIADKEDNIWYSTANGLLKYQPLPFSNLTLTDKIKGELLGVDKDNTIYTSYQYNYRSGQRLFIYKYNKENDSYRLHDSSMTLKVDVNYDTRDAGWDSHYLTVVPTKDHTLIFNEETLLSFDGIALQKHDLKKLPFSNFKFELKDKRNDYINEHSIFKDSEGYAWFCYNGNYIKTNGITFTCFGTEAGLKSPLELSFSNIFDRDLKNNALNVLKSDSCFYLLEGNKFKRFDYDKYNLPPGGSRLAICSDGKNGVYFFFDSIASKDKKNTFLKFEDAQFTPFKINNPSGIEIASNLAMKRVGKTCIIDLSDNGLAALEIDEALKTVTVKEVAIGKEYLSWQNKFKTAGNKLFLFPDATSLMIFPLDSNKLESGEPLNLSEYEFLTNVTESNGTIYFSSSGGYVERETWTVKINPKIDFFNKIPPALNIISVSYDNKDTTSEFFTDFNGIEIPFHFNPLKIEFKGICMTDGSKVKYKYFLEGLDDKWNEITEDNITYSSLSPGTYKFKVLACNNHGVWNETPAEFSFTVLPPWQRTWWAYCMYVVAGFAAIRGYLKKRTKKLEKEKEKLEKTVKERTEEVTLQKHLLEEKNKEMIDSITYAKRIQSSLMPTDKYISRILGKKK